MELRHLRLMIRGFSPSACTVQRITPTKEQSDLDLPLPDFISDKAYLSLLDYHLKDLFERIEPQFVFFQSGVDVIRGDKLGRMDLTWTDASSVINLSLSFVTQMMYP